jgi:hypothetical protein
MPGIQLVALLSGYCTYQCLLRAEGRCRSSNISSSLKVLQRRVGLILLQVCRMYYCINR